MIAGTPLSSEVVADAKASPLLLCWSLRRFQKKELRGFFWHTSFFAAKIKEEARNWVTEDAKHLCKLLPRE
jgi:hypothetical protein